MLFYFFWTSFTLAVGSEDLFYEALVTLQKGQAEQAGRMFSEFLKTHPQSLSGRFNLALSLYRQTENPDPARAYWRQILFEDPYNKQIKDILNTFGDTLPFWLLWPKDLFLALIALSWIVLLLAFFKNKELVYLCLPVWLIAQGLSAYYFYHRLGSYSSLMQDSVVLSAPDSKAPVLFKQKSGALVKVLAVENRSKKWSHVQISPAKTGWLESNVLLPLDRQNRFKLRKTVP